MRPRLIALYALATMNSEGPVHGYQLSERVAERTGGAWRPGAGTVYPALNRLTARRLAPARTVGPRRVYSITPKGRALLARIRSARQATASGAPDLSVLWAEVAGVSDVRAFLLLRLRRSLDAIEAALDSATARRVSRGAGSDLREETMRELTGRLARLRAVRRPTPSVRVRRAGRRPA